MSTDFFWLQVQKGRWAFTVIVTKSKIVPLKSLSNGPFSSSSDGFDVNGFFGLEGPVFSKCCFRTTSVPNGHRSELAIEWRSP